MGMTGSSRVWTLVAVAVALIVVLMLVGVLPGPFGGKGEDEGPTYFKRFKLTNASNPAKDIKPPSTFQGDSKTDGTGAKRPDPPAPLVPPGGTLTSGSSVEVPPNGPNNDQSWQFRSFRVV